MRILAVSDVVDPALYDHFEAARWRAARVDLLISCGDLPPDYLTELAARFDRPLLYVLGNHDGRYAHAPPAGCRSIDGRVATIGGLRILGLGGAPPHNGGTVQQSEAAMARQLFWIHPRLWRRGIGLLVTHAPPRFTGAATAPSRSPAEARLRTQPMGRTSANGASALVWHDPGHRGYAAFGGLVRRYHPRALLHGHTHLGYGVREREWTIGNTRIVDVYGHYLLEL